ncbi:Acetylgalactosaminyl-O-glycosyl-glycoprotein beta-1,3-N-acetylglucosaminyltransferase [Colletotrichum chlorophyti]|uniref:Hexosyltransferase n=1 Tax=Colletotrichum chlorophyti TaxID=708187 RepID=A0A1Q8S8X8_9PEZI|nr:Acetylgalactosaminyl-O-glycosyl-glycoprotein beta-1,3-N-acetylglucosaminyltransferase [Colletotrichum chlorophyti]
MASVASCSSMIYAIWMSWTRCIQRRFFRVFVIGFGLLLVFFIHLAHNTPSHHKPYEPPITKLVVHGNVVDGLPAPTYPLEPFPYSPQQPATADDEHDGRRNPWLAAVISTASDIERRMLIRSTWMRLYDDLPFDRRFVVSNPGPQWTEVVANENRTFGDMIVLDHIAEDDVTANTIKTLEFYKWLISHDARYEFVTKMDTDLWLNARGFWDRFLSPTLSMNNDTGIWSTTAERTVIGELYYSQWRDLVFPHGAMYTVTWDMVELLSALQEKHHVVTGEDMTVAILMLKARERANFINFRGSEKFDYDDADSRLDGTAWARQGTHPNAAQHALVGDDAIAVHQLKDESLWLKVTDAFDEKGIKKAPLRSGPTSQKSLSVHWHDFWYRIGVSDRYVTRFDRIPKFFWTMEDGHWICDSIWDLGRQKTGFMGVRGD